MYYFQGLYSLQNSYLYLIPVSFHKKLPVLLLTFFAEMFDMLCDLFALG